jgi:hypothetical protein
MLRRRLAKRKREDAGPDAAQWEEDAAADVDDTLASVQLLRVAIALLLVTTFRPHERLPACIYGFAATPSSPTGPSSTKT